MTLMLGHYDEEVHLVEEAETNKEDKN